MLAFCCPAPLFLCPFCHSHHPATLTAPGNGIKQRFPSAWPRSGEAKLSAGHGERIAARTWYAEFRRQNTQPNEVISIYYDSRANLVARGIIPGAPRYGHPNPFPGGFAPDPKG